MRYEVELKPRARKDLHRISKPDAARIIDALEKLGGDLTGDVKRLTDFAPEYRLRVGDYRVLFEIEQNNRVVVYRVRDDAILIECEESDDGDDSSKHPGTRRQESFRGPSL